MEQCGWKYSSFFWQLQHATNTDLFGIFGITIQVGSWNNQQSGNQYRQSTSGTYYLDIHAYPLEMNQKIRKIAGKIS